jgi:nitrile hydratase subunit beta
VNGAHDMGGMHGFGPIVRDADELVFHADWERVTFSTGMAMLLTGRFAVDQLRRNWERQDPADYLAQSYYERWLTGITAMAAQAGLVSERELAEGRASATPSTPAESTWSVDPSPPTQRPRFAPGDRVRARVRQPTAHTREPRYVRGRVGVVELHYGGEPLPELAGEGIRREEHLYRVRFQATELWGPEHHPNDAIYIDLIESYLEPVT